MYDAWFTLDTLYDVARYMNSFASQQSHQVSCIEHDTHMIQNDIYTYIQRAEDSVLEAHATLQDLQNKLSHAQWELDQCVPDEDGGDGGKGHWQAIVEDLQHQVDEQEAEVARREDICHQVKDLGEQVQVRCEELRSSAQQYCTQVCSNAETAATGIQHCADAMTGYWDMNI